MHLYLMTGNFKFKTAINIIDLDVMYAQFKMALHFYSNLAYNFLKIGINFAKIEWTMSAYTYFEWVQRAQEV